jgi:hypothetical protein
MPPEQRRHEGGQQDDQQKKQHEDTSPSAQLIGLSQNDALLVHTDSPSPKAPRLAKARSPQLAREKASSAPSDIPGWA